MFAVQDFVFFKQFMVTGPKRELKYSRMLVTYYRILWFADFTEEVDSLDWMDMSVFLVATILILIVILQMLHKDKDKDKCSTLSGARGQHI